VDKEKQEEKTEGDWNYSERRSEARKKISLKRTFAAEVHLDEIQKTYLYIVDISSGGLKVMTDLVFPKRRTFLIRITLNEPYDFPVEVVWHKQMVGYMNIFGLKFVEMSDAAYNSIGRFVDKFSIDMTKKISRVDKMLSVQRLADGEWKNFYAYVMNVNPQGMEFTTDEILPTNEKFTVRCFFEHAQPPIELNVTVLFQKEISMGRQKGWMEFSFADEASKLLLSEFLERQIQGEIPQKLMAPLEDFSLDFYDSESDMQEKKARNGKASFEKIVSETEEAVDPEDKGWIP
jgi:hypothetical protein